jgi:single-stranded-DNA-specific exonuclease
MNLLERKPNPVLLSKLKASGYTEVVASLLASRMSPSDIIVPPGESVPLLPYESLKNATEMAFTLADAIQSGKRLLILADYDADGATACSVGLLALKAFGANVGYIIPDRAKHGYGLSPAIAEIACSQSPKPDYLITVDNGISSFDGIKRCNELGVPVLVTDHHLPADSTPDAKLIVNPNQVGCRFESKAMAGCGVMFYVMRALQDELFDRGVSFKDPSFDVYQLLPFVAIGTISDVVSLDQNNRELVRRGLERIRSGCGYPGIEALAAVSSAKAARLTTMDIGFGIGPRINAAGRLEKMDIGVECLTSSDPQLAMELAVNLNALNIERKEIEADISEEAFNALLTDFSHENFTIVVASSAWHQGVVGIVASRLKDRVYRPTIVFTQDSTGLLKGSGRSIPGLHLRDALDLVDKRNPGVIVKFGGHAMAAGLTIVEAELPRFKVEFEKVVASWLKKQDLNQVIEYDGQAPESAFSVEAIEDLDKLVWGQNFPGPLFCDTFTIESQQLTRDSKHLRMTVSLDGKSYEAIKFRHFGGALRRQEKFVYRLDVNSFRNTSKVQLLVEQVVR